MLLLTYLVSLHHYSKIFAVHQIKLQIRSPQSVLCVLEDSILHEAERTFQYRKDNNMHASPSEDWTFRIDGSWIGFYRRSRLQRQVLIVVKTRNATLAVWQQWLVAATQSVVHIPIFPLSVSHFSSVLFCLPLSHSLSMSWLSYSWQSCVPPGHISSRLCNVNIGNTTHDRLQISSHIADTSTSEWSEQDKILTMTLYYCFSHNRVNYLLRTFWVMHLRCHFKNLPSSKQSKTCFHWPSFKTRCRGPN